MGWPLIAAAAVAAGASYFGAQSTNSANRNIASSASAKNVKMMREGHQFSATQAKLADKETRWQQQKQMNFQKAGVQQQQDYQTHMANTAFQRGMKDMKKSGLNPILAYNQGGANAPPGSMAYGSSGSGAKASASGGSAVSIPAVNEMENAIASAKGVKLLGEQLKNIREDTALKQSQKDLNRIGQMNEIERHTLIGAQILGERARTSTTSAQGVKSRADAQKTIAETNRLNRTGDGITGRSLDTLDKMYKNISKNFGWNSGIAKKIRNEIENQWENLQRKLGNR